MFMLQLVSGVFNDFITVGAVGVEQSGTDECSKVGGGGDGGIVIGPSRSRARLLMLQPLPRQVHTS